MTVVKERNSVSTSSKPSTPPLRTTSSKSNIGVVESTTTTESPLGQGMIMFIPNFQVTPLCNQLLVDLSMSGPSLMFTCKSRSMVACQSGRDGEKE